MKIDSIIKGDCIDVLKTLPDGVVNTCVTSPPYFGLRDYGTGVWIGGDTNCKHRRESKKSDNTITGHKNFDDMLGVGDAIYKTICPLCGAIRVDKQIGLEETPDQYVQKLVEVFREVRRVLRDDGTLWLNLGDSYFNTQNSNRNGLNGSLGGNVRGGGEYKTQKRSSGHLPLKEKDLIGIPWRVAFALQADGWYLRQDIIWHKPNPMPESVTDRCTKSHEYIFLLSKSKKYYFDHEAVKEGSVDIEKSSKRYEHSFGGSKNIHLLESGQVQTRPIGDREFDGTRNKRSVWTVTTKPFSEAHFATFPEDLIEPCVLAGCPESGIVLDPFMGSGTTALVAKKLARHYLGSELNQEYIDIANRRLSNIEQSLFLES